VGGRKAIAPSCFRISDLRMEEGIGQEREKGEGGGSGLRPCVFPGRGRHRRGWGDGGLVGRGGGAGTPAVKTEKGGGGRVGRRGACARIETS